MKNYGLMAAAMAILSLYMAITHNAVWLIGGSFSLYLAWQILAPLYLEKECTAITNGKVLSIRANGTFLGGRHQPLHDAEIAYLDRVKTFKNLPPNFIHDVSPGDIIEIKYNAKNPSTAFINFIS